MSSVTRAPALKVPEDGRPRGGGGRGGDVNDMPKRRSRSRRSRSEFYTTELNLYYNTVVVVVEPHKTADRECRARPTSEIRNVFEKHRFQTPVFPKLGDIAPFGGVIPIYGGNRSYKLNWG